MSGGTRIDVAIEASADALLAACAVQTGTDPYLARQRAIDAVDTVFRQAEQNAHQAARVAREAKE